MITRPYKNTIIFLIILAAGLSLSLPVLLGGFPKLGDDALIHAVWSHSFIAQWQQGEWYPRWLAARNQGLGSPAFFYYAPVPYWATSALSFSPISDALPWAALARSVTLALILSGFSSYLWLQAIASRRAALVGSLLYTALPYHLAIDLYARSAIGEFWAFAWMPLILFFATELLRRSKNAGAGFFLSGLAVSYALLVMTHLPTTLIFTPILLLYICFVIKLEKHGCAPSIALAGGALCLGLGLAAIYLLPAMLMQKFVSLQGMGGEIYFYGNYFLSLSSTWVPRYHLYATIIAFATCCGGYVIARKGASTGRNRLCHFIFLVALFVCFMMVSPSRFIWALSPTLQTIQFPWRFNAVLTLACAGLIALAWTNLKSWGLTVQRISMFLSVLIFACCVMLAALRIRPESFKPDSNATAIAESLTLKQSADPAEYRTIWNTRSGSPKEIALVHANFPQSIGWLNNKDGKVTLQKSSSRELLLEVQSKRPAQLTLRQFYFPGWRAEIAKTPVTTAPESSVEPLSITPTQPDGLMMVPIPAGSHRVRFQLQATPPERWGKFVSLASFLIVLGIGCIGIISLRRARP